jgi:hypothetical protein
LNPEQDKRAGAQSKMAEEKIVLIKSHNQELEIQIITDDLEYK